MSDKASSEQSRREQKTDGCMKALGITSGVVLTVVEVLLTIGLGMYAFANPDPKQCWVVRDLHSAWLTKADAIARADAMDIDVTSGFPMEMHAIFVAWFMWGFFAKVFLLTFCGLSFFVYLCRDKESENCSKVLCAKITSSIAIGFYVVQGIVWLGMGAVWRYSKGGAVASGDELARRPGTANDLWEAQL